MTLTPFPTPHPPIPYERATRWVASSIKQKGRANGPLFFLLIAEQRRADTPVRPYRAVVMGFLLKADG
jgi:hypothetical protein